MGFQHVIALETTDKSPVKIVRVDNGWPGQKGLAAIQDLEQRPMNYFHGQMPK
jgi:hypothetical protein